MFNYDLSLVSIIKICFFVKSTNPFPKPKNAFATPLTSVIPYSSFKTGSSCLVQPNSLNIHLYTTFESDTIIIDKWETAINLIVSES